MATESITDRGVDPSFRGDVNLELLEQRLDPESAQRAHELLQRFFPDRQEVPRVYTEELLVGALYFISSIAANNYREGKPRERFESLKPVLFEYVFDGISLQEGARARCKNRFYFRDELQLLVHNFGVRRPEIQTLEEAVRDTGIAARMQSLHRTKNGYRAPKKTDAQRRVAAVTNVPSVLPVRPLPAVTKAPSIPPARKKRVPSMYADTPPVVRTPSVEVKKPLVPEPIDELAVYLGYTSQQKYVLLQRVFDPERRRPLLESDAQNVMDDVRSALQLLGTDRRYAMLSRTFGFRSLLGIVGSRATPPIAPKALALKVSGDNDVNTRQFTKVMQESLREIGIALVSAARQQG